MSVNMSALSFIPMLTEKNRVERFYSGGLQLDQWQGIEPEQDGHQSEEFLISTVEYIGTGNPPENGISRVILPNGKRMNLRQLIAYNPAGFLGERYAEMSFGHIGVQARAGDSASRLIIQSHPDDERARTLYGIPFGKTESWYIHKTREIEGTPAHVYCGFREGITRKKWEDLFERQDTQGMLACLHKFEVREGDCFLVKAGTPHAIGSGCLFIEMHQACDFTLRMERRFGSQQLTDDQMHFGGGFPAMFNCCNYTGADSAQTLAQVFKQPVLEEEQLGGALYKLIGYEDTSSFAVKKLIVNGVYELPVFDGHYLLIGAKGSATLRFVGGTLKVPQGRCVFVPAECRSLWIEGQAMLIVAYPFMTDKGLQ